MLKSSSRGWVQYSSKPFKGGVPRVQDTCHRYGVSNWYELSFSTTKEYEEPSYTGRT